MSRPTLNAVTNVRDYGCARMRRLLDSFLAGELTVESNHEILDHLERCSACREESEARETVRASVRRLDAGTPGPREGFEDQVKALVARAPRSSWSAPLPALALLAAALFLAVGLFIGVKALVPQRQDVAAEAGPDPALLVAARTQIRCAEKGRWPQEPPGEEILEAKIGPSMVPALRSLREHLRDYSVVVAHHCSHGGRPVVHFILRGRGSGSKGNLVSVVVMARLSHETGSILAEEHFTSGGADRVLLLKGGRHGGVSVVGAEAGQYIVLTASAGSEKENLGLARSIIPALAAALL